MKINVARFILLFVVIISGSAYGMTETMTREAYEAMMQSRRAPRTGTITTTEEVPRHPAEVPTKGRLPISELPTEDIVGIIDSMISGYNSAPAAMKAIKGLAKNRRLAAIISDEIHRATFIKRLTDRFEITEEEALQAIGTRTASEMLRAKVISQVPDLVESMGKEMAASGDYRTDVLKEIHDIVGVSEQRPLNISPNDKKYIIAALETRHFTYEELWPTHGTKPPLLAVLKTNDPDVIAAFARLAPQADKNAALRATVTNTYPHSDMVFGQLLQAGADPFAIDLQQVRYSGNYASEETKQEYRNKLKMIQTEQAAQRKNR